MIFILHKNIHSESFSDKIKSTYSNVYHSTELSSEIFQIFYKNEQCINNGDLTSSKPKKAEATIQKNEIKKDNETLAKIVETKPIGAPVTKAVKKPLPPPPPPPKPFSRVKPVTKKAIKTPPPPPPPKPLSSMKPITKQTIKPPPPPPGIKSIGKKKPVKNNVSKLPPPLPKRIVNSKSKGPPPLPKK
jgi:hypothetical protein